MSHNDPLDMLRTSLARLKPGPVGDDADIDSLLAKCWDRFSGSNAEGMNADKLLGRIERPSWDPPSLSFEIERHGGTVMGSSRAELHSWQIDLVEMSASLSVTGHLQLKSMAPRLDVKALARDVAAAIRIGQPDPRLKWLTGNDVRVLIGEIIPAGSAVQQTLAGRRKRFWTALDEEVRGWQHEERGRYRKKKESE
ncbi:MAG: hypothetical protein M9885_15565 [Burkholderiaceae bacterium]|nr:hypothetical protein [Burkholderiaceae bacterium]